MKRERQRRGVGGGGSASRSRSRSASPGAGGAVGAAGSADAWPPITRLRDAIVEALAMHARFGRCEASLLVAPSGRVISGWVVTHDRTSMEMVANASLAEVAAAPGGSALLLISAVGDDDVSYMDDPALRRYADLCDNAERAGAAVLDWIFVNGEMCHSLRTTMSPHLVDGVDLSSGPPEWWWVPGSGGPR